LKEGVCQRVFALFEPEKFKQAQAKTSQGQMPTVKSVGIVFCVFLVQVSQGLKSGTAATDTPLSFCM